MNVWAHGRTRNNFWGVVCLNWRTKGDEYFEGDTSGGDGDGLIRLSRRCWGPLTVLYFRAPVRDACPEAQDIDPDEEQLPTGRTWMFRYKVKAYS